MIYGRGCCKMYPIRASASSPTLHFRCLILAIFGTHTSIHACTYTHTCVRSQAGFAQLFICCMIVHLWHRDATRFESLTLKKNVSQPRSERGFVGMGCVQVREIRIQGYFTRAGATHRLHGRAGVSSVVHFVCSVSRVFRVQHTPYADACTHTFADTYADDRTLTRVAVTHRTGI